MWKKWWLNYRLTALVNNKKNTIPTWLHDHYQYLLHHVNTPISDLELLAIDIEMTGLDPRKDQMVSIGVVPIIKGHIQPKFAQYKVIKIQGSVGQSAVIHGVLDKDLNNALPPEEVLQWLFEQSKDKVLIAHHAPLDLQFLQHQFTKQTQFTAPFFAIDTLDIQKHRQLRQDTVIKTGSLRLNACREKYNLPVYHAHNALTDALACAELLLAQLSKMGGSNEILLAQLLTKG
jgi:DNA polymerase-3 subunit epsilon